MIEIDITVESGEWTDGAEALAEAAVRAALAKTSPSPEQGEVSVVLADDAFVQKLNKEYRGKDAPTNVLSFHQFEPEELKAQRGYVALGDIIVAYETVAREAAAQNKRFEDHLTHLFIHGTLHLLGYDHIDDDEAEVMEALEIKILAGMGIKNPYEDGHYVA
jgi:probable rRNA maturation factor